MQVKAKNSKAHLILIQACTNRNFFFCVPSFCPARRIFIQFVRFCSRRRTGKKISDFFYKINWFTWLRNKYWVWLFCDLLVKLRNSQNEIYFHSKRVPGRETKGTKVTYSSLVPGKKVVVCSENNSHFANFLSFAKRSKCNNYCISLTQDSDLSQVSLSIL